MIITCGSSAGGNLAAVLPIMARDLGNHGIVGQVLNSPVLCHPNFFPKDKGYEYNSFEQNANSAVLGKENMLGCWAQYYPDPQPDVYANPLLVESVEKLPATCESIQPFHPSKKHFGSGRSLQWCLCLWRTSTTPNTLFV
jgi:acetyl esterase/lipase